MSAKPWEKWTVEGLRQMAKNHGPSMVSEALKDFAALKEAEQRGERCVLPEGINGKSFQTYSNMIGGAWRAVHADHMAIAETQQAAIEDLARKIKEGM